MTTKPSDFTDINALAIEACDMWQEHLSSLANDPAARAELTRFLEPQRRLFADWAAMMQQGDRHGFTSAKKTSAEPAATPPPPPAQTPRGDAHGDDALRVAQLALRVAELEKRLARLEAKAAGAPRRTQRAAS